LVEKYFDNPNDDTLSLWPAVKANNKNPTIMNIDKEDSLVPAGLDYRTQFFDDAGFSY
jgi:hypothetical protein